MFKGVLRESYQLVTPIIVDKVDVSSLMELP